MTQDEEKWLRELTLLIDRLKRESVEQISINKRLQQEIDDLKQELLSVQLDSEELSSKYSNLLAGNVIAEDEGDWLIARKRLENMQKQVQKAIKLLQTE